MIRLSAVSEAPRSEELEICDGGYGRFRYCDLKEAALFAADAMGFQSEVVGKKSSCVVTPKLKFTDISMKSGSNERLILTRVLNSLGSPMWLASPTR